MANSVDMPRREDGSVDGSHERLTVDASDTVAGEQVTAVLMLRGEDEAEMFSDVLAPPRRVRASGDAFLLPSTI